MVETPAEAARPQRLIFVNRFFAPDLSATSQILTDLCRALALRGFEQHVVTSRLRYESAGAQLSAEEDRDGAHVHRVATTGFGRGSMPGRAADYASFLWSARREVSRLARPRSIVIAKTDPPMLQSWIAGAVKHGPFVCWVQDLFPEVAEAAGIRLARGIPGRAIRALRDRTFAGADAIVAVGDLMAERIRAMPGVRSHRVHVIPNWADGAQLRPVEHSSNPLRSSWGLDGKFVVGYSGNLGRVHEFETTLRAAQLLRSNAAIRFHFVGAGHYMRYVQREVEKARLTNVSFAPYQPRESLSLSLSAVDLHLCTLDPKFEGLVVPSKLYGIMAAGRPVLFVGAANGEVGRVLDRHAIGFTVAPGDATALAGAIESIAGDAEQARTMGASARALFEAEYDLPVAAARWERLLTAIG
ncbi:MAG TPA: glycosyltransferase family 4 protein [Usitatibacter sp.]|nr:glycosyltransferase family 4 protein [Usitatibacter sp.]